MKKRTDRRENKRARNRQGFPEVEVPVTQPHRRALQPLRALTKNMAAYITAIQSNTIVFAIGPAGSGKTYCPIAIACEKLTEGLIEKLIVVRPCVEAGEPLGFLPGEVADKIAPHFKPVQSVLERLLGKSTVKYFIEHGRIEMMPLAYMRGTTLEDCMVILDEAQNTTPAQMKMFLTRIGHNCNAVVDGDITQNDIGGTSGLADALDVMRNVPSVAVARFTMDDCVRSGITRDILFAYANRKQER